MIPIFSFKVLSSLCSKSFRFPKLFVFIFLPSLLSTKGAQSKTTLHSEFPWLVEIGSTYTDKITGKETPITGYGTLVKFHNLSLVLTTAHLTQGDISEETGESKNFSINRIDPETGRSVQIPFYTRGADNLLDLEIIYIDTQKTSPKQLSYLAHWENGRFIVDDEIRNQLLSWQGDAKIRVKKIGNYTLIPCFLNIVGCSQDKVFQNTNDPPLFFSHLSVGSKTTDSEGIIFDFLGARSSGLPVLIRQNEELILNGVLTSSSAAFSESWFAAASQIVKHIYWLEPTLQQPGPHYRFYLKPGVRWSLSNGCLTRRGQSRFFTYHEQPLDRRFSRDAKGGVRYDNGGTRYDNGGVRYDNGENSPTGCLSLMNPVKSTEELRSVRSGLKIESIAGGDPFETDAIFLVNQSEGLNFYLPTTVSGLRRELWSHFFDRLITNSNVTLISEMATKDPDFKAEDLFLNTQEASELRRLTGKLYKHSFAPDVRSWTFERLGKYLETTYDLEAETSEGRLAPLSEALPLKIKRWTGYLELARVNNRTLDVKKDSANIEFILEGVSLKIQISMASGETFDFEFDGSQEKFLPNFINVVSNKKRSFLFETAGLILQNPDRLTLNSPEFVEIANKNDLLGHLMRTSMDHHGLLKDYDLFYKTMFAATADDETIYFYSKKTREENAKLGL